MKKMHWRLIGALAFIAIIIGVHYSPASYYLSFEFLKANRDALQVFVSMHFIPAQLIYLLTYIGITAFALPVTAAMSLLGGFLFGAIRGMVLINIGATTGATFAFLGARYLLGTALHEKYQDQLTKFNENMESNGAYYLLSLRFLVVVPFFLVNILAGFTKVPLATFIWTTVIGIMPASFIFSYAGKELGTIHSVADIFSWQLILAFTGLAILAFLPLILQRVGILDKP